MKLNAVVRWRIHVSLVWHFRRLREVEPSTVNCTFLSQSRFVFSPRASGKSDPIALTFVTAHIVEFTEICTQIQIWVKSNKNIECLTWRST